MQNYLGKLSKHVKSHDEIRYKGAEYFWSVESQANGWDDDEYNGTYAECVTYAWECNYNDENCVLVFVQTEDGVVRYTYLIDTEWNLSAGLKEKRQNER